MTSTTTQPERLSEAELTRRFQQAYPEGMGPGEDHESGTVIYGQPHMPRVGKIPHLLDPEIAAREDDERYWRLLAMTPAERQAWEGVRSIVREEMSR